MLTEGRAIVLPLLVSTVLLANDLGNGKFVDSKAVDVRLGFAGNVKLTHTVHVVAGGGQWRWILPSRRFRDYKADRCSGDAGSGPPPQTS